MSSSDLIFKNASGEVQMDPIASFFVMYFNYIIFGLGLFLLIWGASVYYRKYYAKKDELKIIDGDAENDKT
jgi:hypothetical protein